MAQACDCCEVALCGALFADMHLSPNQAAVVGGHLEFWLSRSHCDCDAYNILYTAHLQKATLVKYHELILNPGIKTKGKAYSNLKSI